MAKLKQSSGSFVSVRLRVLAGEPVIYVAGLRKSQDKFEVNIAPLVGATDNIGQLIPGKLKSLKIITLGKATDYDAEFV